MKNLTDLINSEESKIAVVCGLGPSLSESIEYIIKNRKDIVLISCNDIDLVTNLSPDYWVFANSVQTVSFMNERFRNHPKSIIVHSDSVDTTPKKWIEDNLSDLNYVGYDQRHFNNSKCKNCPNSCENFIDGRLTIQEELQKFTNNNERYSTGDTVAVHMLALSILLGCKKIYISGVDLDYSKGYFNSTVTNSDSFSPYLTNILNDFRIINESSKKIGVEIINTNNDSLIKTIFKTEKI